MSYDVNVLVNGNRCRQYLHKGRTYIEAKEGSEYVIEVKNNSWEKILAVLSVDGLNIVDGKTATPDGAGYVMPSYTAQRFYGFQYSQEKVATFKFGALGAVKIDPATGKPEIDPDTGKEIPLGYAASKQDGSEKNAGIIGVRIWDEVAPLPPPVTSYHITNVQTNVYASGNPYAISASWATCSLTGTGSCYGLTSSWANWASTASYSISSSYSIQSIPNTAQAWNTTTADPTAGLYGAGRYGYTPNSSTTNINVTTNVNDPNNYQSLFGGCAGTPITGGIHNSSLLKDAIADAKAVRQTACSNTKGGIISPDCSTDRSELRDRFNRVRATSYNAYSHGDVSGSYHFNVSNMVEDHFIPVKGTAPGVNVFERDYSQGEDQLDSYMAEMECERGPDKASFDMETQWGAARNYKVKEVTFERKDIIHSFDIYYASRESLVAMGIDLGTEKRVSFPQSFEEVQYAQPPKGWNG